MKIVSLFAGCGGLDLGFEKAGLRIVWANEFDKSISETYRLNHPNTILNTSDIRLLTGDDIPDCDGIIGGPPCQAWSEGGKNLGLQDERGRLFLDYIRIISEKRPKFFVIENVPGILSQQHLTAFKSFVKQLESPGYKVDFKLLDAADFGVAQNRKRVIIVGFRSDIHVNFCYPTPSNTLQTTLRQAIGDLAQYEPRSASSLDTADSDNLCPVANHEVYNGAFDVKYMSRNRVRSWNEPSFTIQAQAKNEPLHPSAPKMIFVSQNQRAFAPNASYRRLSVRECARIQSFPDDFKFFYNDIRDGYKMVGNAVPPLFAEAIARQIVKALYETNDKYSNILAVTIFPNKNNDTYRLFSQNSQVVEYYFGQTYSGCTNFRETIKTSQYFAPIINGKICSIYKITSSDIRPRSELPHLSSEHISLNDKRIVLSLALSCQLQRPYIMSKLPRGWSYHIIPYI